MPEYQSEIKVFFRFAAQKREFLREPGFGSRSILPPWPSDEQMEVCAAILEIEARRKRWEEQKAKIREVQARHKGGGLLKRLLEDHAKERARG